MQSLIVTHEGIIDLLDYFKEHFIFIMNCYGTDHPTQEQMNEKEKFEKALFKLIENVFGDELSRRMQCSKIFSIVNEAENNKKVSSQEWNNLTEINDALALLEKIKIVDEQLNQQHIEKILKFSDYLNLCIRQQIKIDDKTKEINEKVKEVHEELDAVNTEIENLDNNIIKQQEDIDKHSRELQTSFMGILTIFTGVVFTLFGGLNILSQLFGRIKNVAEPKELFGALLIGLFFAWLIYSIAMGLLLFSKKNITETRGYGKNIVIVGTVFVILFCILSFVYYQTPYPQYPKLKEETGANNTTMNNSI